MHLFNAVFRRPGRALALTLAVALGLALAQPGAARAQGSIPASPELQKTCTEAMNGDHEWRTRVLNDVLGDTARQHQQAAATIARNERHVILAYGAMWALAAGFVLFLWSRQRHLKSEIAQLRRDLEAAIK